MEYTIEDIYNSYINGQKKQMSKQINWYGEEFWADFYNWLENNIQGIQVRYNLYTRITIIYNFLFPHINQQKIKG